MQQNNKITIKQNEYQKLIQFKQFNSADAMDKHVYYHCKSLRRGQRQFLRLLSRYAVIEAHIGVCWRKNKTLADDLEVSARTIHRYVSELVKLGVIKVVNTFTISEQKERSKAKQGANIYVILPCSEVNKEEMSGTGDKVTELVKAEKSKSKNKSIRKQSETELTIDDLDHSFLPSHIPDDFIKVTKPFFNAETIFKLWGKVLLAAKIAHIDDIESLLDAIVKQFKSTVFMLKRGCVRDLMGYWYAGIYQVFVQHQRRSYFSRSYNWLTS